MKSTIALGLFIVLLLTATPAVAQSPSLNKPGLRNVWPENCKEAQGMIGNRIRGYKNHRDNYIARYNRIVDRSQNLVNALRAKGFDPEKVNKLESDLITLKEKIQKFGADADAAIRKMEEANDYRCGKSEGEFASRMKAAKDLMVIVRADVKDIRSFVTTTIREDIKALRGSRVRPTPALEK